jgi:hypothetical protein
MPSLFVEMGVLLTFFLGIASIQLRSFLISASPVAGIIAVSHHTQLNHWFNQFSIDKWFPVFCFTMLQGLPTLSHLVK